MKPRTIGLACAASLCVASFALRASATSPPGAADVAARVQSFHRQTQTLNATFVQTYYTKLYDRYERSRGRLAIAKPSRIRFDYNLPNGKVIASDGRKLTMWEPGDGGSAGQFAETPANDASLLDAFSFFSGDTPLEQRFALRLLDSSTWAFDGDVLELRPRAPNPRYARIVLFVNHSAATAGVVRRVRIDDAEGNRNKFEFLNVRFNRPIPADHFAFAPPAGARRLGR